MFYVLAGVTVISAVCSVTFRSPVYCAIWFAMSLLGTAGLFLFQGAQFLGVATIVVYAGAILVTFLFVLMLAQPEGDAFYDRISWEGLLAACTGALLVGVLTLTLFGVLSNPKPEERPVAPFTSEQLAAGVLTPDHMARLGGELFSRYLVAVEVAGTLLLVALVGAVAIVATAGRTGISTAAERLDPRTVISPAALSKRPAARRRPTSRRGCCMDEVALLENYLIVGGLLFGIGLIGFMSRRNMIVMFLAAEMMLQGVSVSLVAWGRYHNDWGGQVLVIFILTVAACEAAIALALMVTLYQKSGSLDIAFWHRLREDNRPAYVDLEVPEVRTPHDQLWPQLTPAGIEPPHDIEEVSHRSHV